MFRILDSVCQQLFWDWEKLDLLKWILKNSLFIGFAKFEIKQWFSAYQDQICVWFSLARLRTVRVFFSGPFSKKETALSFFSLLGYASRTCSMTRQYFTSHNTRQYLSFTQSCKLLSKFSKLSAILKHGGTNIVMMTSILVTNPSSCHVVRIEIVECQPHDVE